MVRVILPEKNPSRPADPDNTYLLFTLSERDYAVAVGRIREIIGATMLVTNLEAKPRQVTQDHFKGLVNLSSRVIPVIDFRGKFGLEPAECTDKSGILVVDFVTEAGDIVEMGAVVDQVWGVESIAPEKIAPAWKSEGKNHVSGLVRQGGKTVAILDLDRVLEAVADLPVAQ